MLGPFAGRAKTWFRIHPGRGVLLSLQHGELSGKRRVRTLSHLEACSRCRARAARIEQEWKRFAELAAAEAINPGFKEEELIARIQDSIRAWSEANVTPSQAQTLSEAEARCQLEALLEVYLGKRAAAALVGTLGASPSSRQETLAAADSALAALLGRKGATAVSARLQRIMAQALASTHRSPVS